MTEQWLRSIDLQVGEGGPLALGGFAITSTTDTLDILKVEFEVERDEKPWPNSCRIRVWNLNADHRDYLSQQRAVPCRLKAGYRGGSGLLFEGYLRDAISEYAPPDWITTLTAGDGELSQAGKPLSGSTIQKTWSRGTPLAEVLKDFAKELNVDAGNVGVVALVASLPTGVALSHGFTVDGPIIDELNYFVRSVGLVWSIQDSALQFRLPDVPASVGPLISKETGLIGSVAKSKKTVTRVDRSSEEERLAYFDTLDIIEGRCLLLPDLKPGIGFVLKSEAANGTCLCTKTRHRGDTFGNDWYTEWEAVLA